MQSICFVSMASYGFFEPSAYEETGGGGAKRQIHLLSTKLTDWYDISVVVGDYGQPSKGVADGVKLFRAYSPDDDSFLEKIYRLFRAMRTADADLYIYRGRPQMCAIVGAYSKILGAKYIYHISNDADLGEFYDLNSMPIQWLFRQILKRANAVVTQTPKQRNLLQSRFSRSSTTIPNACKVQDVAATEDGGYILWVGRIDSEQKRPELVVDIADALPDEQFIMLGPSDATSNTEAVLSDIKNANNIDYLGPIQPTEISDYYKEAKLLVSTSKYEGFPNVFMEAWTHGIPVVSLEIDPNRFLKGAEHDVCADGDLDRLIELIKHLSNHKKKRTEVAEKYRKYVERHYGLDSIAARYSELIDSVLDTS